MEIILELYISSHSLHSLIKGGGRVGKYQEEYVSC